MRDESSSGDLSIEAIAMLGLPDSPVIRLAIRNVAELLRPLDELSKDQPRLNFISRFRVASYTVLERLPIDCARQQLLIYYNADTATSDQASSVAFRSERTDWLGQAKVQLQGQGFDLGPDAKSMATRYGWDPQRI